MWSSHALFLIVCSVSLSLGSCFHQHAWDSRHEYKYLVQSQTLTTMDDQQRTSGIAMKGVLIVNPQSAYTLHARIPKLQYVRVNEQGPHEFETKISQMSNEKFDDVPISGKPFEIAVKHGVIRDIMVDSDVPVWEVNLLKGIVGQLQVDTQGENSISSSSNQIPDDEEQPFASYKVMEDSVGGNCEVYYDIVPLSEDLLNDQPDLVPLPHLDQENQKPNFIEVRKTKDYQKCKQRQAYRFNQFGSPSWPNSSPKPSWSNSKQNDELVSQVSTNHMVLSGNLKRFTIQSSVMKSNIFVKPRGQDSAIGTVSSKVNLTLVERHNASEPMQLRTTANQLVSTGNLVYMYNNPFSQSGVRPRQPSVSRNSQQAQSSESSSSSSSSSEESHKSPKTFGRNNQQDDSSSSSSSSEEVNDNSLQPTPRLNEAPNNPFLPLFIGINGKSIHSSDKTDAVQLAASLAIQVVEGVQDPNVQEPDQTLEKFTMLQNLLRTMNTKQLIEVEQHVLESSKQNAKSDLWANIKEILYQIITQIGTGPALECIKKWLENKIVQGLDAAFIVSRIPKTCLTPTPQYVRAFYELISSPEVKNQNYLKVSGPIAFAELLRNAQNNKKNYPVHSFGDMKIPNEDVREYISYLAQELKKAIEENNVTLIQTYIVALGYTAHPKVIEVFEPYLEGRQPVSTFQRLMMVNALSPLTATSPKFVRSVLYKIYSNIQEADEIRAAAFYNVIKSKPSLLTMIRMAQFTNYDQSDQVNSAVVTTINSLSRLTQWQALDMALKGRIAKRFLTHKRFHVANSRGHYADSTKNNDPVQRYYLETIQGHKTLPKYAHFEVDVENDNLDVFGMKFEYGMSNIQQLLQYYHQSFPENKQEGQKKSPAEKLVRALNIQPNNVEQFEGYLLTATTNEMQFYPFDKNVLQNLFENLKEHAQKHQQLNVNRLQNRDTAVSLSTESGLPFAYTIQRPILHQIEATNAEAENNKHSKIAKGTVNMLFASRIENRFGFTTPFEHQQYIGGIDRDYHVNVPMELKVETQPDKHQICLELKVNSKSSQQSKTQNQQVMHMSTVPFVTRHDILDVQPLHHNRNSQIAFASARSGVSQHRASYGAGVITVEMEFDKEAAETMNNRNIMKLLSPSNENDVHYKKVDVFLDSNAARRGIRLNIAHAKSSSDNANQQSEAPTSQTFTVIDGQPNSEARRQQFLTELNKAIQPADNFVWDVDVEYPTLQKQIRQVLTVGVGHNNVDEKYRTLVYWNTQSAADGNINYEALGTGNMKLSQKTPLNIENVLNREQQNNFDFNLQYGKKYSNGEKMHVNGNMLQSNDLRDKIKDSETVKLCQEESKQGKKGSQACQRAAVLARMKDRVKISTHVDSARHNSIVEKLINIISIVFGAEVVSVNQRQTGKSTIDIELKSSPSHDQADISISSSDIELTLSLHDPSHNAQSSLQTSSQLISQLPQLATEMSSQSSSGLSWQLASELLLQLPQLATEMSSQSSSGLSWQLASKLSQLSSRLPSQWSSKLLSLKKQVELAAQTPAEPASCTVGRSYVITFDSAYYYLNDQDLWQVVFIPDPKSNYKLPNDEYIHLPKDSDVAILSREKDGEIQVRFYFGDKEVQFEKVNDNIRVSVDGRLGREYKKQNKQDITVYQDKQNGQIYMQIYELKDRSIKLHSGKYGIFAVYDGQHILLHAYDKYRNAIHGLCGNYDDDPVNDIRSPNNCVVQKSEKLSAMYTLIEDGQQGFTAKNKYNDTCVKNPHYQSNVISDVEAGRPPTASNWGYHGNTSYGRRPRVKGNKKSPKNSSNKNKNIPEVEHTNEYDPDQNPNQKPNKKNRTPLQYRTRVDEKHNEICFSIRPLPQCDQNSEPVETKVKTYAFYCTEKNQVSAQLLERIQQGANPDLSQKPVSKTETYTVPVACQAA
ncbi:vitellogenin precursor [Lasius niger]|uniref:Vitellogenin n=1 Tax=Lasius niger TaxID=67767 RepID=A0A0J7KVJ8_LASNI|nr:vitellogenin precursor [Lasius niger]